MNIFKNFTLDFYDVIKELDPDKIVFDDKRKFFERKYKRIESLEQLNHDYECCISELSIISEDFYDYFNYFLFNTIYNFIDYIRFIEKVFFYKNDDNSVLYVEKNEKENIFTLYYKPQYENFKIKIEFTESKIKSDNIFDEHLMFCKITINRTYGKQMQNIYNFIENEIIKLESEDIDLLLNIFYHICKCMCSIFNNNLNSIVEKYTDIKYLIDVNVDFRLRAPSAKYLLEHGAYK